MPPCGVASRPWGPVSLGFGPAWLVPADGGAVRALGAGPGGEPQGAVVVEPFISPRRQLRLFARFTRGTSALVNGEPAPRYAVLAPGDELHWAAGCACRLALFIRPQIGPPPRSALGKPCPVCRTPFVERTTCVTCVCGVTLHCEADAAEPLQCAQQARDCPICRRPIVLTPAYVGFDPAANEE